MADPGDTLEREILALARATADLIGVDRSKVVKDSLVQPDPFRLAHRQALRTVVARVVRGDHPPDAAWVEGFARGLVGDDELPRFVTLVLDDLAHLHEGNVARYGLRPSELASWSARP